MAELEIFDNDASVEEIIPAFDRDGAVIIRNMLPDDGRLQIIDDFSDALKGSNPGSKSGMKQWEHFHGKNTVRFCGLAARSRAFVDHA